MKIYAARHGQTDMNLRNEVSGVTDVELTELGKEQARILADKLLGKADKISLIIASPMKRAQQTAHIVAEALHVPVVTDERLREQDYGIFEGQSRFSEGFLSNKRQFAVSYPGGESMFRIAQRVYNFLDDAIAEYAPQNFLIVAHGGILRVVRTYFMDMTNDEYFYYNADNASFEMYDVEK